MGQKDRFTYEIKFTGRRSHNWSTKHNLEKPLDALNALIGAALNALIGARPIDFDVTTAGLVAAREIIVGLCAVAAGGAVASFRILPTHPVVHNRGGRQICCHVCHDCGVSLIAVTPEDEICDVCNKSARVEEMTDDGS